MKKLLKYIKINRKVLSFFFVVLMTSHTFGALVFRTPFNVADTSTDIQGGIGSTGSATIIQNRHAKNTEAYSFNGSSANYFSYGNVAAMNGLNAFTVSAWVRWDGAAFSMVASGAVATKADVYSLEFNSGRVRFAVNGGGWANSGLSTTLMTDGRWHFVTGVFSASTSFIYVDGKMENSSNVGFANVQSNANAFSIGARKHYNDSWLNAQIDEVRFYDSVLTGAEILTLYNTKKWFGGGDASSWNDANNWIPVGVPATNDDVVLDHEYIAGVYTVNLPGAAVVVGNLQVIKIGPNNITLNTNGQNLTVNNHFDLIDGSISGGGKVILAGIDDGPFRLNKVGGVLATDVDVNAVAKEYQLTLSAQTQLLGNMIITAGSFNANGRNFEAKSLVLSGGATLTDGGIGSEISLTGGNAVNVALSLLGNVNFTSIVSLIMLEPTIAATYSVDFSGLTVLNFLRKFSIGNISTGSELCNVAATYNQVGNLHLDRSLTLSGYGLGGCNITYNTQNNAMTGFRRMRSVTTAPTAIVTVNFGSSIISQAVGGSGLVNVLQNGTRNWQTSTVTLAKNLSFETSATDNLNAANIFLGKDLQQITSTVFNAGTSTITMTGGNCVGNICNLTTSAKSLANLTINSPGDTSQLIDPLKLSGNLTLTAAIAFSANSQNIKISGNWDNNSSVPFTGGTATVIFDGSTAQSIISGSVFFSSLEVVSTSSVTLQDDTTVSSIFTMTNGTFDLNGRVYTVNTTFIQNGGTINGNGGVVIGYPMTTINNGIFNFGGGVTQRIGNWDVLGGTVNADSALIDIDGDFILNGAGATFNAGSNKVSYAGNFTILAGTFDAQTGTSEFLGNGDSIADTYTMITNGSSLNHLLIKSNGIINDTTQLGDALTVVGNLNIDNGELDTSGLNFALNVTGDLTIGDGVDGGSSAQLTAYTSTITVTGNWTRNTIDGEFARAIANQTVILNGTGSIVGMEVAGCGTVVNSFYNLSASFTTNTTTMAGTGGDTCVLNNLNLNGGSLDIDNGRLFVFKDALAAAGDFITFTNASTVSGTGSLFIFSDIAGATLAGGDYGSPNVMELYSTTGQTIDITGALTSNANTTILNGNGGLIVNTNNNALNINNLQLGTALNTVAFNSGNSNIAIIGNLGIGNVVNNITTTGGTWTMGGNFTNDSTGTVDFTGSTVILNSGVAQTIAGTAATTFNNLSFTATAARTITLPTAVILTVSGTLTIDGSGGFITIDSSAGGTQATINKSNATFGILNNFSLKDARLITNTQSIIADGTHINAGNTSGWFNVIKYYSVFAGTSGTAGVWSDQSCGGTAISSVITFSATIDMEVCPGFPVTGVNGSVKDLTIGDNVTLSGGLTVNGNYTQTAGNMNLSSMLFFINQDLVISGGTQSTGAITLQGTSVSPTISGTGSLAVQTIINSINSYVLGSDFTFANITQGGANDFSTNGFNLTSTGTLTVNVGGSVTFPSGNHSIVTVTGVGNLNLLSGVFDVTGNFNYPGSVNMGSTLVKAGSRFIVGTVAPGTSTLIMQSSLVASDLDISSGALNNLEISSPITTDGVLMASNVTVNGYFMLKSGVFDTSGTNFALTVAGDFQIGDGTVSPNTATFTANASLVTLGSNYLLNFNDGQLLPGASTFDFNSTTTGKTIISGGKNFNNVNFIGATGGWTLQDALTVNGGLTVSNGSVIGNNQTVNVGGNFQLLGATYNIGNGSLLVSGNIDLNSAISTLIAANATIDTSMSWLAVSGATFTSGTSTVTLKGTGAQSVGGFSGAFNNLLLNNATGVYTIFNTGLTINGNFTLTDGTIDTSAVNNYPLAVAGDIILTGGNFIVNDSTITLQGNWSNTATTVTQGISTVSFNAATSSTQQINGDNSFYNLSFPNNGARTISIADTSTQTILAGGSISASGSDASNQLQLYSQGVGTWLFNYNSNNPPLLSFVDVKNSDASASTGATVAGALPILTSKVGHTNSGGNIDWFPVGVTVTITGGATIVNEDGTNDTISVVLDSPPILGGGQFVTVTLSTVSTDVLINGTTSALFNFDGTNWSTPQLFTISAVDNIVSEGTRSAVVNVTITSSPGDAAYDVLTSPDLTIQVDDNDSIGLLITETSGSTTVTEASITDQYTVQLSAKPATGTQVIINLIAPVELSLSQTSIIFDESNFSSPVLITVTAPENYDINTVTALRVQHVLSSTTDPAFVALPAKDVTVTYIDNEPTLTGVDIPPDTAKIGDNYIDFRRKNKTIIGFNLTQSGSVAIAVYDVKGRKVLKVVSDNYNEGKSFYEWDLAQTQLRAGLYFVQISTSFWSTPQTQKLIIVR